MQQEEAVYLLRCCPNSEDLTAVLECNRDVMSFLAGAR